MVCSHSPKQHVSSLTSPGIRNPSARNNLRAMKKGDLAFFYHSNCKVPAIVGVMEIVREHSPDCRFTLILYLSFGLEVGLMLMGPQ